jgi:hypothetical protein
MAVKKSVDERRHFIELVLKREVSGIEQVQFCVRQVVEVRVSPVRRKNLIVPAPNDQRRWLVLAKERLEFGIERNVRAVVVE